jgi:hypothetical protein
VKEGESPGSFRVLYNYTFYDDKTVKDLSFIESQSVLSPGTPNQYLEERLIGTRSSDSLIGTANITMVSQFMGSIYTNFLMQYNASYNPHDWKLNAHFVITTNNTLFENELSNITPQEFFPVQDANIVEYNSNSSGNKYTVDLTAIIPYNPVLTTYSTHMSSYIRLISFISQNRTLEIDYYGYISPSGLNATQHIVYKGGFTEHLRTFTEGVKRSYQQQAALYGNSTLSPGQKALIEGLQQLANNFEVKSGTSYTQLMTPTANIITTPLVREKGTKDPIETLVGLRNVLLKLSQSSSAGFNRTQVLNQEITLKPGDPGISRIQPNQTILGNLENVKVNPETTGMNQLLIEGIIGIILAASIIAVYALKRAK